MRLRSKIGWLLLLVVLLAGAGYWQMRKPASPGNPVAAPTAPTPATPVASEQVVEVQSSNILNLGLQTMVFTLPVSGNLKALNTVTVKARAAGELLSLFGREGDTVKASQVLAKIDPTEFQRKLRQAEQQADAAKTQIDIAQRQYENNKALVGNSHSIARLKIQNTVSQCDQRALRVMATMPWSMEVFIVPLHG